MSNITNVNCQSGRLSVGLHYLAEILGVLLNGPNINLNYHVVLISNSRVIGVRSELLVCHRRIVVATWDYRIGLGLGLGLVVIHRHPIFTRWETMLNIVIEVKAVSVFGRCPRIPATMAKRASVTVEVKMPKAFTAVPHQPLDTP